MTTSTIFLAIIIIGIIIALISQYSFFRRRTDRILKQISKDNKQEIAEFPLHWSIKGLIIVAVVLVALSMFTPFIFTRLAINSDFNFRETGQIGDTIGGLTNPFIAVAGVIVTGLAFYVQFLANRQQIQIFHKELVEQKKQTKQQQFESQFYEMLRLHRENVLEMKIKGYDFEEAKASNSSNIQNQIDIEDIDEEENVNQISNADIKEYRMFTDNMVRYEQILEGRKIFVSMKIELEFILNIYRNVVGPLDKKRFKECYDIFFSGLDAYKKRKDANTKLVENLLNARNRHQYPERQNEPIQSNVSRKIYLSSKLYINYKPFSGHASRLAHYFRHLYLAVKSIADSDIITNYTERMRYLKLLRAQLSNHEQVIIFYNWLGGYGEKWQNREHKYFTEYCMIHNLWYESLLEDPYINQALVTLESEEPKYRKTSLFETNDYK